MLSVSPDKESVWLSSPLGESAHVVVATEPEMLSIPKNCPSLPMPRGINIVQFADIAARGRIDTVLLPFAGSSARESRACSPVSFESVTLPLPAMPFEPPVNTIAPLALNSVLPLVLLTSKKVVLRPTLKVPSVSATVPLGTLPEPSYMPFPSSLPLPPPPDELIVIVPVLVFSVIVTLLPAAKVIVSLPAVLDNISAVVLVPAPTDNAPSLLVLLSLNIELPPDMLMLSPDVLSVWLSVLIGKSPLIATAVSCKAIIVA